MTNVELIKQSVTMRQAAERYGIDVNRGGFICCPFHGEDTPSCKIYDSTNSYHCFGCGESGDVIKFVQKLNGLDFKQTITRFSWDFGVNIADERTDRQEQRRIEREQAKRARAMKQQQEEFNALYDARERRYMQIENKRRNGAKLNKSELVAIDIHYQWLQENLSKRCGRR